MKNNVRSFWHYNFKSSVLYLKIFLWNFIRSFKFLWLFSQKFQVSLTFHWELEFFKLFINFFCLYMFRWFYPFIQVLTVTRQLVLFTDRNCATKQVDDFYFSPLNDSSVVYEVNTIAIKWMSFKNIIMQIA